jgi:hypothetical protein
MAWAFRPDKEASMAEEPKPPVDKPGTNEKGADAGRPVEREEVPSTGAHEDTSKDTAKGTDPGGEPA